MDRQDNSDGEDPEERPAPAPVTGAPPPDAQAAFRRRRRLIPMIVGGGLLMQSLDATVLVNALPAMARSLNEDTLALNLAITVYLLSSALFLPLSGWLADRFGARRVFMLAMIGFATTSLLCGFAQNLPQLIAGRFLQGMAGAMLLPVGRIVLLRSAPKDELIDALTTLTLPVLIGPIIGPPLGGFIVTFASWRDIFFLNVPIAIAGVLLIRAYVPHIAESDPGRFDMKGFVLSALGLGGLVFGLQNLGRGILPLPAALALAVIGAISSALFIRHARKRPDAILDLSLLKNRSFFTAVIGGWFPRLILGASPFLLALLLQVGLGMSALNAGLITFVAAIGAFLMKTTAPPILRRFGFRGTLIFVSCLTTVLNASYALFGLGITHWLMLIILFVSGFFRSLQFSALNTLAFADVPSEQMSKASTLSSVGQQVAQTVGISVAALLVHGFMLATGATTMGVAHIAPAFVAVSLIGLTGVFFVFSLPRDAGAAILARRPATDVD
jgi:EmrB/QacA subfamily drug resistance transporter